MKRAIALLCFLNFVSATAARAEELFPKPGWQDAPNPLASPHAIPGGTISAWAGPYPESLNYLRENNSFVYQVFSAMYETLLSTSPLTAELEPGIAERWSISDDQKTFTFWINPAARWSDGQPITADDVRWTYDTI
ncbi:MAG: ABC transporter substrate-binding protein, partial [Verrucomicrobia bacterium]|nr:ABC transporter substrate-binding protein [Verrucomicrobiota bacterium]